MAEVSEKHSAAQPESAGSFSEARFKELADSMPAIVWSSSADGRTDYLNQHYYSYTGLPSSVPGIEGWHLVVHPEDMARAQTHYQECFQNGVIWEQELRLKRHDGEYRWHLSRSVPVHDENGKAIRWYATSTDIHDQKMAEARAHDEARALETINRVGQTLSSELNLDNLVQSLTDAATELVGAEFGSFFYNVINEAGESYLLYTLSGVPKSAFERFPMPRNTEVFDPTFKGEGVVRSDDITKDPRYGKNDPHYGMPKGHLPVRSYLAIPVLSRSGEVLGGLFFGHSTPGMFTARHERILLGIASQAAVAMDNARLYQRLKLLNSELEARVTERTSQLEAKTKELEGFTYSVSHDLRGPLRAIMSTSMILKEDFASSLPSSAREELDRQAAAASKMGTLIDDLLKLSRLGRQEMDRKEIDVSMLATEIFEEQTKSRSGPELKFSTEPDLKAKVDSKLFRLVMENLIGNAVKFSPEGGTIVFGQTHTAHGEAFFLKDEGIGFDPTYSEKVFMPFERLVLERDFPGTGIGLANVKRIIERHGGAVWATAEPGEGSTFFFTVPSN